MMVFLKWILSRHVDEHSRTRLARLGKYKVVGSNRIDEWLFPGVQHIITSNNLTSAGPHRKTMRLLLKFYARQLYLHIKRVVQSNTFFKQAQICIHPKWQTLLSTWFSGVFCRLNCIEAIREIITLYQYMSALQHKNTFKYIITNNYTNSAADKWK